LQDAKQYISGTALSCHHNYVTREHHYGENVLITRKGAVRAREGDTGIIPGSMGARSYIVRGKGNPESFMSCSHGAGRAMSRAEAKRRFTMDDHAKATAGVECRKDADVIDETPMAYKSIDAVMEAQLTRALLSGYRGKGRIWCPEARWSGHRVSPALGWHGQDVGIGPPVAQADWAAGAAG
jgi:RNA-splicing ligase RtcB